MYSNGVALLVSANRHPGLPLSDRQNNKRKQVSRSRTFMGTGNPANHDVGDFRCGMGRYLDSSGESSAVSAALEEPKVNQGSARSGNFPSVPEFSELPEHLDILLTDAEKTTEVDQNHLEVLTKIYDNLTTLCNSDVVLHIRAIAECLLLKHLSEQDFLEYLEQTVDEKTVLNSIENIFKNGVAANESSLEIKQNFVKDLLLLFQIMRIKYLFETFGGSVDKFFLKPLSKYVEKIKMRRFTLTEAAGDLQGYSSKELHKMGAGIYGLLPNLRHPRFRVLGATMKERINNWLLQNKSVVVDEMMSYLPEVLSRRIDKTSGKDFDFMKLLIHAYTENIVSIRMCKELGVPELTNEQFGRYFLEVINTQLLLEELQKYIRQEVDFLSDDLWKKVQINCISTATAISAPKLLQFFFVAIKTAISTSKYAKIFMESCVSSYAFLLESPNTVSTSSTSGAGLAMSVQL